MGTHRRDEADETGLVRARSCPPRCHPCRERFVQAPIDAVLGTIDAVLVTIDAVWGTIDAVWGTIDAVWGTIDAVLGTIDAGRPVPRGFHACSLSGHPGSR